MRLCRSQVSRICSSIAILLCRKLTSGSWNYELMRSVRLRKTHYFDINQIRRFSGCEHITLLDMLLAFGRHNPNRGISLDPVLKGSDLFQVSLALCRQKDKVCIFSSLEKDFRRPFFDLIDKAFIVDTKNQDSG